MVTSYWGRLDARPFIKSITILLALVAPTPTVQLSQELCSSQNTASGSSAVPNHYNSNGLCQTSCSGFAFAVVQDQNCWCSNYAPADTTSITDCSEACPGYPYENCGSASAGLFGYVALGKAPSGTIGTSTSSSTTPTPTPTSTTTPTSIPTPTTSNTVQATPSTTSTTSTPQFIPVALNLDTSTSTTSTPTTFTTSSKSSETTSSSSWSATPFTSVMTVTGQVKTLTITPTAPPATATTIVTAAKGKSSGFFSNSGQVAGTFIAVAIVLLLLIAGAAWFFLRRHRRRQPEAAVLHSTADSSTPQRRPSRLSQMGLVGAAGPQRTGPTIPTIQTSGWGPSNGNGSEKSPADTLSAVDRRSSYPRVVDQRLEPTALWNPLHDNGSHVSVRSFRDDQDYSRRMLRIANPDDG